MIGGNPAAIALGMESYFDGVLDEVAIFDYSFTAADVHLLYNASRIASWPVGATTSMPLSTVPPPGATTFHAVTVGEFVESEPLVIPLVDLATPVNLPLAVSFTDTDPTAGSYGGVVVVTRASNESDISQYVAYWGSSSTQKLSGSAPLGSAPMRQIRLPLKSTSSCPLDWFLHPEPATSL